MTAIDETFATRVDPEGATARSADVPGSGAAQPPSVHPDAIAALMAANHGDPFAVLGPHRVGPRAWEVRAVLPEARAATLVMDGRTAPFEKRHPDGFWVARVEGEHRPLYEIEVESWDGAKRRRYDPYVFGSSIEQYDVAALREVGTNLVYRMLGAQSGQLDGIDGFRFAVWAPNARKVSVVGDFNDWDGRQHPMCQRIPSGIWELFIPNVTAGARYKFRITGCDGQSIDRADPYGFAAEVPPHTASIVADLNRFHWQDHAWLDRRSQQDPRQKPISIYEVHLGSWRTREGSLHGWMNYRDLAHELVAYCQQVGFTHVELLPISEHPFDPSWGYQPTGLYAPTSRFGDPAGFARFVDRAHRDFLLPCAPVNPAGRDDRCARAFLQDAGRLLYRRPLDDARLAGAVADAHGKGWISSWGNARSNATLRHTNFLHAASGLRPVSTDPSHEAHQKPWRVYIFGLFINATNSCLPCSAIVQCIGWR